MVILCFSIIHGLFISKTNTCSTVSEKLRSGKYKTKGIEVRDLVTHGKVIELPKRLKKNPSKI